MDKELKNWKKVERESSVDSLYSPENLKNNMKDRRFHFTVTNVRKK